jgi:hypothetical protein
MVANPIDPSLPIRYVAEPTNAMPIPSRASRRSRRGAVAVFVAALLIVAGGAAASYRGPWNAASTGPFPGEFRLRPGNQVPPGIVVPLR